MTYVYIISNSSKKLYIGISDEPNNRLLQHNQKCGANFTVDGKYRIVFLENYLNFKDARKREIQLKKWRREKKDMLIQRYSRGLPTRSVLKL